MMLSAELLEETFDPVSRVRAFIHLSSAAVDGCGDLQGLTRDLAFAGEHFKQPGQFPRAARRFDPSVSTAQNRRGDLSGLSADYFQAPAK